MEGSTRHRRTTLSDQMSVLDASNLRDLLRVRDDEDDGRHALAGLTLGAVLGCEDRRRTRIPTSRTLLEIIKDEESGAAYRGLISNQNNKKSWRSLKDRLRLRRAGVAWSSSIEDCRIQISNPFSADPTTNNTRRSIAISPRITSSDSETENSIPAMILPQRNESQVVENVPIVSEIDTNVTDPSSSTVEEPIMADRGEEQRPMRMSLMALLEETDRQAGGVGSSALLVGTEEEEEKEEDDKVEGRGEEYVCCVCMVRHKGAAFIPCGHTFCRLCSRELWVSRGNCPICNGFILEILDIF